MDNDAKTTPNAANELTAFIRHESTSVDNHRCDEAIRRHALEQLVEARLGGDMTSTAHQLIAADILANDNNGWSNAANRLAETSAFQLVQSIVEECSLKLGPSEMSGHDNEVMASKKAKIPAEAEESAAPAPAPKSFSLFDMLDSQKTGGGGGSIFASLPPRIMAYQVIEAREHEKKQNSASGANAVGDTSMTTADGEQKKALELLEKADDMEDLSPDPDSWEEIRTIMYEGLTNSRGKDNDQFRYLKVHKSLFEKCQGNNACKTQLWGLAQNLVGSILALSNQKIEQQSGCEGESGITPLRHTMDLCWDVSQTLLSNILPQLAMEHVVSCVGSEREIERMLLGLCMILSNDFSSCILGMMEPFAGWFEVWIRFVDPKTFAKIVHASHLGEVMLRRCETLGRNSSSAMIGEMVAELNTGDIEHCIFLQSLSTLRSILFRCSGSTEIVTLLHRQFTSGTKGSADFGSFLLPDGFASIDDVQNLLKGIEQKQINDATQISSISDAVNSVLKPFRVVTAMKEINPGQVGNEFDVMCTQTIDLIQDLM